MKKILSIFTGISVLSATGLNIISCKNSNSGKGEIQLITDGGNLNDKSFNQQAWETVQAFAKSIGKRSSNKQPAKADDALFIDAYKAAFKSEAEIIVANGGFHQNAISKFVKDNKNKWVIYTDEQFTSDTSEGEPITKAASLTFSAEQSGFLAGIAAAVYLNINYETYKNTGLNIGSFGGANITGVTSFMAGLKASTEWWNNKIAKKEQDELKSIIKILKRNDADTSKDVQEVHDVTGNEDSLVTTGFDPGNAKTKSAIEYLLDAKHTADVIMPVAGPQTGDVLNFLEKDDKYKNIRVMGVDTNQVELYSDHPNVKNRFITSALKKLQKAITDALTIWNKKNPEDLKKWFSGKTINDEQNWIGIAPSENFTESNINNLINTLKPELDAVSTWWRIEIVEKNPKNTFTAYNDSPNITLLKKSFDNLNHKITNPTE